MNRDALMKLCTAIFALLAAGSFLLPWKKINTSIIEYTISSISGFDIVGIIPCILLIIVAFVYIIGLKMDIKRYQSIIFSGIIFIPIVAVSILYTLGYESKVENTISIIGGFANLSSVAELSIKSKIAAGLPLLCLFCAAGFISSFFVED